MYRQYVVYCYQHPHKRDEFLHQTNFQSGFAHKQAGVQVDPNLVGVSTMHRRGKSTRMSAHAALDSAMAGVNALKHAIFCSHDTRHTHTK